MATAIISHHSPGRTRLRLPDHQRNRSFLTTTGKKLEILPGIKRATVNPSTGSILVNHKLSLDELCARVEEQALLSFVPRAERTLTSVSIAESVARLAKALDEKIKVATVNELDGRTVLAGSLIGLSVLQLRRGKFLPAGMVLVLMAMEALKS